MNRFELRRADYSLDDDQQFLQEVFAKFFAGECPTTTVRAAEPLGFDPDLWRRLTEIGVASMALPESAGGEGASLVDLTLVAEEYGRAAAPVPLIEHVVAGRALAGASVPGAVEELLDGVRSGTRLATLALAPLDRGGRQLVPAGAVAADVVFLDGDQLVVGHIDSPAPLVANQGSAPLAWWDPGTVEGRLVLAAGDDARRVFATAVAEWKVLTAAALVGLTEAALALAVEFAKTRQTMGVPIGSLQGVAFPLTEIAIGTSGARNLARRAAWYLVHEPAARPELPAAAFAYAAATATHGTAAAAHAQGGLGFTIEADASLFFLRAKGWSVLGGDPRADVEAVGAFLARDTTDPVPHPRPAAKE